MHSINSLILDFGMQVQNSIFNYNCIPQFVTKEKTRRQLQPKANITQSSEYSCQG